LEYAEYDNWVSKSHWTQLYKDLLVRKNKIEFRQIKENSFEIETVYTIYNLNPSKIEATPNIQILCTSITRKVK
jgi:hypothetical protein